MGNESGTRARSSTRIPRRDGDGHHLNDLDGPFAHDMAAQDRARRAVDDQFAEPGRSAVDDRAGGLVEAARRDYHFVRFSGLRLGQPDLGIFRVGEAADRIDLLAKRDRRAAHGVGGRHEAVLDRLRNQHQAAGDVARREDVRGSGPKIGVDAHVTPRIGLDAGPRQAEPGGVGHPAHRHDDERSLGAVARCRPSKTPSARRVGVFSNDSMVPKFSRTAMPDSRKAAATAADTSSSSVGRMRGPAWKSWTREPKALKIEATCTPVAPPPMTSIDGGTAVKAPGIAVGGGQLEAGDWQPPARAAARRG